MKSGVVVHDVLEAYLLQGSTAHFFGCLTESNINKAQTSEDIRCGIGNVLRNIYDTEQDITFSVTTAMHSDHFIEYQSGGSFSTGQTVEVWKHEVGEADASLEVTITGTPVDGVVKVIDRFNEEYVGVYATGTVTITGATEGETYTVFYEEEETTADVLDFDATKYPENVEVMLHGIAYDPKTNLVISDIYYQFPIAKPDGNLDLGYALASNITPQITFRAIANADNSLGKYIVVDR